MSNIIIYSCGPEEMLYSIYQIFKKYNLKLQVSLERIMRCGCDICSLCAVDPLGLLICKDGPVFNVNTLEYMDNFRKYKRNFTDKKITI